ncbi:Transposase [Dyadobacter sp. SG02]|uniref:IS1182 family transposase n=1 Tax=Dyadobacter sp. SG02 TaxID=1855291 RepID=UPI0008CBED83|nr:IS1182 family transposase [Dyadobacter sp. SG02]SEI96324.1 Transposase [Dyadobacter sp. SG02]SEJ25331.1 Transposase [Dyadobacter sp. SG02]SEJ63581.1 Transposase [Dyadobacter sp. SG02]SEJ78725.1 Transposase [Dyadobacter sp. SG02]
MQGKKIQQERLFINFQLSEYVPADNFYRQLSQILDLRFLYKSTADYYGSEGQKSIDPVVFMKLMLVGYLENLTSDRRIIRTSRMRMDILFFLGYDLDEEFPWHSTLSRTRKLYGEDQFITLFKQVLKLCVDHGLISGKRQAIDSALVRANASISKMVEKQVMADANVYVQELADNVDKDVAALEKPICNDKTTGTKRVPASNESHVSPSDPDARITMKPGKPMNLYYRSQVSVDTASHLITYIGAFPGNAADNVSLPKILEKIVENMQEHNIQVNEILADTGYSSGDAMRSLAEHNIEGYIPNTASYKKDRQEEGFTYDIGNDRYTCKKGVHATFRCYEKLAKNRKLQRKIYRTNPADCMNCPIKSTCLNYMGTRRIKHSLDKPLYDQMYQRMSSDRAKTYKKLRSSTVEPVIGSLINYTGMGRINAKGIEQANKCMIMAAIAYNLKKLLKYKAGLSPSATDSTKKSIDEIIYSHLCYFRLARAVLLSIS